MSSEKDIKKAKKESKKLLEKSSVTFSSVAGGANTPHKATKERESSGKKELKGEEAKGTASTDKPSEKPRELDEDDIDWDGASEASKLSDKRKGSESGFTKHNETTNKGSDSLGVVETTNAVMVETLQGLTLLDEYLATGTTLPAEILKEIGEKVNKKGESYFNTLSTTPAGKITIRCKERQWTLPTLDSLEPDTVLAWVQRLKELAVDMSSYKCLILSDISGSDKPLSEQEVTALKLSDPVQAFAHVVVCVT